MTAKKNNILSVNFSSEAIVCLQQMGYLNGLKKSTGDKNISGFISRLVIDYLGIRHPAAKSFIEEKLWIIELNELGKERDKIQLSMEKIAQKINNLKAVNEERKL